jgi:DMSO/TMAO reductase YedYZ molybdopterin-dependent catalytic subunit
MPRHAFTLTIDGAVDRPLSLSYADLQSLPAPEREVTLDCGKGTRTASIMKGPSVLRLIEMAAARGSACRAVFYCTDGHREEISLADLVACDAFLAFPGSRGKASPVRLVVPGKFGDRWAKFVTRIEVVADDVAERL